MIIKQPDILVKLGLIMQYDNITGGQDSGPLSKTTYRDVGLVNNSRLTEHQPSQHAYQQKVLRLQTIKAIVDSRSFKSPKSDEPRRVQVLDLYCLTRFESEISSKGIVY